MNRKSVIVFGALLALGSSSLTFSPATQAGGFNPMNMMNPSKWMGGKNRRYDDDYDRYDRYDRYGYYDRYGPGYGRGWGPGYGGWGPGYGGYGYGWPGYGYAPGYGVPGQNPLGSQAAPPPRPE